VTDTDKELLELAAKAAGLEYTERNYSAPGELTAIGEDGWGMVAALGFGMVKFWNPLVNDADAFRLAVKLRMGLDTLGLKSDRTHAHVPGMLGVVEVPHGSDPYAATRRAIVRAAASIGKEMGK
jgi:hypothetical protein